MYWRTCCFALVFAALAFAGCHGDQAELEVARGGNALKQTSQEYVVVFQPGAGAEAKYHATLHAAHHQYSAVFKGFAAMLSSQAATALKKNPNVLTVEPAFSVQAINLNSSDAELPDGIDRIDAEIAHLKQLGAGARVAIVDTGIDLDHPDLAANIDVDLSQSFISKGKSTNNGDDDQGHGTHVAGTIAAVKDGKGVVGVAPEATLVSLKVLNQRGSGTSTDIIAALDFITKHNNAAGSYADMIHVANFSLGGTGQDTPSAYRTAFEQAVASGCFIAAAAGNEADDAANHVPASYDSVFTVSAMDPTNDAFAYFSNFGPDVDIIAPGVNIYSTVIGGYGTKSGTSMATPHVAGAAALYVAHNLGNLTKANAVAAVRAALLDGEVATITGDSDGIAEPLLDAEKLVVGAGSPGNAAPIVTITSPSDGDTFASGTVLSFAGTATDAEDGDLGGALGWTSNIDGALGTGETAPATLSDGVHIITAAVTDSASRVGVATITITVGNPPPEPTTATVSISYELSGPKGRDLLVTVAVYDDLGAPVFGAIVAIDLFLDGSLYAFGSGSTEADGTATWRVKAARAGTYTTTLTSIDAALSWDGETPANTFTK